ncbi:hypothetical protein V6Z11_A10G058600 [Gossypium hirsutum]|uniref:Uncharacterized protein n=1 Tax=Gossypium tomentosum TaxID=34277 RepID=A0A5D2NLK4_GOSTO|nr:hypothetical protein ES332_A10G059900v1 [Gossypium tomentosum]
MSWLPNSQYWRLSQILRNRHIQLCSLILVSNFFGRAIF